MIKGEYVLVVRGGMFHGYVAEICPACNGGKVVGGKTSPVMPCPVCRNGDEMSSGVVMVEVPIDEARRWIDRQLDIINGEEADYG